MAKTGLAVNTALAALIGGLDGLASSRDASKGRSWNSPGLSTGLAPVLSWGWGPAVQVGSLGVGAVAAATGRTWGTAAMCAGAATLTRSAAFKIAQGRSSSPIPAQAMVARPARSNPDGSYNNHWDPTSRAPGGAPGNAYMATVNSGTDQAYLGQQYDRNAMGPVKAQGWSGTPGQYGPGGNMSKGQAPGLL